MMVKLVFRGGSGVPAALREHLTLPVTNLQVPTRSSKLQFYNPFTPTAAQLRHTVSSAGTTKYIMKHMHMHPQPVGCMQRDW